MKLITFTVPCYNSAAYMERCIESLLPAGSDIEIIIVDDGSTKDDTAAIADGYAQRYPDIVKVIHKENGGHGSAINAGIKAASGLFFKVVDSDDLVATDALLSLVETVKNHVAEGKTPDLYITDFVHNREDIGERHVSSYAEFIPTNKFTDFSEMKPFGYSTVFWIHALMYSRETLIKSGLTLPEHTFYVDEVYSYVPLPYVNTLFYLDVQLYIYNIGRADQSVTKKNMFARFEQQIRVMLAMTDSHTYDEIKAAKKGLKKYMFHALAVIMLCTMYFTCSSSEKERKAAYKEMWAHIKRQDKKLYRKLRFRSYVTVVVFLPWRLRFFIEDKAYKHLCKSMCLGT